MISEVYGEFSEKKIIIIFLSNCPFSKFCNVKLSKWAFTLETFVCLFGLRLIFPVNDFSVMSGRSHRFLGITCVTSTFWKVNVSCSRIQHGDLSEDRTPTSRSDIRRSTTRPPRLHSANKLQCPKFQKGHISECITARGLKLCFLYGVIVSVSVSVISRTYLAFFAG